MQTSGAALGEQPAPNDPAGAVNAAIAHVAGSACDLMILPIEDVLGLSEQPNLPNTIDEHPNWRRRLPGMAADLLDGETASARLRMVMDERKA
jgi:4-alpha-glucanotransferase